MKTLSLILLLLGIVLGTYALLMDTSIEVGYSSRVSNLSLMEERQNYLIVSGILIVCGFLGLLLEKIKLKKKWCINTRSLRKSKES